MEHKRQVRYGRQLQKDISEIFLQDSNHYFGKALVTITHVSVSPDLSLARIFLSVFPVKLAKEVFARLDQSKSELRYQLGNKIKNRVRIVPELAFFHDNTEEKASRMDSLIDSLTIPPTIDEEE